MPAMARPYLGDPPDESAALDVLSDYLERLSHSDAISQVVDATLLDLGAYYQVNQFSLAFNSGSVTEDLASEVIPIADAWIVPVLYNGVAVDVLEVGGGAGNWYGGAVLPASVAQALTAFRTGDRVVEDPPIGALWISRDNELIPLDDVAFEISPVPIALNDYQQLRIAQSGDMSRAIQDGQLAIGSGGIEPRAGGRSGTQSGGTTLAIGMVAVAIGILVVVLYVSVQRRKRSSKTAPGA
jgi:hypothetical protein